MQMRMVWLGLRVVAKRPASWALAAVSLFYGVILVIHTQQMPVRPINRGIPLKSIYGGPYLDAPLAEIMGWLSWIVTFLIFVGKPFSAVDLESSRFRIARYTSRARYWGSQILNDYVHGLAFATLFLAVGVLFVCLVPHSHWTASISLSNLRSTTGLLLLGIVVTLYLTLGIYLALLALVSALTQSPVSAWIGTVTCVCGVTLLADHHVGGGWLGLTMGLQPLMQISSTRYLTLSLIALWVVHGLIIMMTSIVVAYGFERRRHL